MGCAGRGEGEDLGAGYEGGREGSVLSIKGRERQKEKDGVGGCQVRN